MPYNPLHDVINFLRRVVTPANPEATPDADLLARFVKKRDKDAFELLVRRHGEAVLAECYRVLRNPQDAEDSLQATLLVFAQKARSIRKGEALGGWLLTTAFRIALEAKKRAVHQQHLTDNTVAPETDRPDFRVEKDDVREVINDEVSRLPDKYRVPIVLCYYQGMSNAEAARQLGQPLGTLQVNLLRGRDRLRDRLTRRGVTLSAGLFAAAMTPTLGMAAVAPELVLATVNAALAGRKAWAGMLSAEVTTLAEAGLSGLAVNKLRWTAATLVALVVVGSGIGWAVSERIIDQTPRTEANLDNDPNPNEQLNRNESIEERAQRLVVPKVLASLKGLAIGNRGDANVKSLRLTPDGKGLELQVNWKHGFGNDKEKTEYESLVTFEYELQTGECRVWVKDLFTGQMRRVEPHRAIVPVRFHKFGREWAIRIKELDEAVAAFEVLREPRPAP